MEKNKNNSFKKIMLRLAIILIFVYFSVATLLALFNVLNSYADMIDKESQYNDLVNNNILLNRQIVYHGTDEYVEKMAREDFMMKKPGDTVVYSPIDQSQRELPIVREVIPPKEDSDKGLVDSILKKTNLVISFIKDKIDYIKEVFILHQ
jgi:cell division protein FtsB